MLFILNNIVDFLKKIYSLKLNILQINSPMKYNFHHGRSRPLGSLQNACTQFFRDISCPKFSNYLSIILVLFFVSWQSNSFAQCNYNLPFGTGPSVIELTGFYPLPYAFGTSFETVSAALASATIVQSNLDITICFYGDMDNANESFDVVISGQTFSTGGFGTVPTSGNPQCVPFSVMVANVESDVQADGDIDIMYNNFGSGWNGSFLPLAVPPVFETFNAQVQSATFIYDLDLGLTASSLMECQDGTNIVFTTSINPTIFSGISEISISPAMGAAFTPTNAPFPVLQPTGGVLDVSATEPRSYNVRYDYTTNGCTFSDFVTVEVFPTPDASLQETLLDCRGAGDVINLEIMFGSADVGGSFTVLGLTVMNDTEIEVPAGGGCYMVTYMAPNPNTCSNAPYTDTKALLITLDVEAAFTISVTIPVTIPETNSPACSDGGMVVINIANNSNGPNPMLTLESSAGGGPTGINFGAQNLAGPTAAGSITYTICLTETNNIPANCGGLPAAGYIPCTDEVCETFVVFNDGVGCGANSPFVSECQPDPDAVDPCPIETQPKLELSCSFFSIPTIQVLDASLEDPGVIFCTDDEVCLDWEGTVNGLQGLAGSGAGTALGDLPGVSVICSVLGFSITIPLIVTDITIAPFGSLGDFCDKSILQLLADALASSVGGDGGGGFVVADTDGDGQFDTILEEYDFPASDVACIPNNVEGAGVIIVRNVTAFPFSPNGYCGDVVSEELNLLELLPIGAIPIAGPIIRQILETAQCEIPLTFSDEETRVITVINNSEPEFANCNETGYVFAEDLSCNIEANWSVPVVFDGCTGGNLPYRGVTAGTDDQYFDTTFGNTPPPIVVPTMSGVYQTAGPVVGSNLPPGTYMVTYTAYNCSGVDSECTFPVVVTTGTPVLVCPNDITVNNDVDECEAVVTGLEPIRGIGCSSVINYSIVFPANSGFNDVMTSTVFSPGSLGTHNDPSGISFPYGVTTITYTMMVDIDGDGDTDDAGETQVCDFDITVIDEQKPTEICVDITIRLDNTGNETIYAVDQNDDTPFIDGGSFDNCDIDPEILIAKPGGTFMASLNYDCMEAGGNLVTLRVTDMDNNVSQCLAEVIVEDFYTEIQLAMDAPELCLEANNPVQLDFSNYTNITLPDGTVINPNDVSNNTFLGDTEGGFGITAFLPHPGSASNDPGTITPAGVYTPGTGTGYVVVSYMMALPGVVIPQNGNLAFAECFIIVHESFELRQPLDMADPTCECGDAETRTVDLGILTGGLEPYTIQYDGVRLDVDGDGFADDDDGQYVYDTPFGHDVNDFQEDLGILRVEYTQPTWSLTVVDARGCEIFRSGSCDNDDLTDGPEITCPTPPAAPLEADADACDVAWEWEHNLPMDNCKVIIYTYEIENPDGTIEGPFNLEALLNILPPGPSVDLFTANYEFELGTSTVRYYAEDAVGNYIECDFEVEVIDVIAPVFINCPYPPVVENAESGHCDAYVNFALPLANDNCSIPVVTQIDNTDLVVGDRFPVGTTILYYQAEDPSGNKDTCQVKVVVNDYWVVPTITCPADVLQATDPWRCDAEVNGLAPTISSVCQDNLSLVYEVFSDAALTDRVSCGVSDASGQTFEKGDSWVRYTVKNQPLLLISEINQSGAVDQLEITNLGPAAIEISCLEIARLTNNAATTETLPAITMLPSFAPTVLSVGQVMVFDFMADIATTTPACYTISYMGITFDEVTVNGMVGCNGFTGMLMSGDVARDCEADSDDAADWRLAELCFPLTIGALNPELDAMADNGTQTSLQSVLPNENTCVVKVTVADEENPFCGELAPTENNNAGGAILVVSNATCNRSTLNIATDCIIGLLNFDLNGTVTPANSTITLISPEGKEIVVAQLPFNTNDFFLEKSTGNWVLDVQPNAGVGPFAITDWAINITCLLPFDEPNANINNDPGQCGASFTWNHPFFADNCFEGTLAVDYSTLDAACTPPDGPIGNDPNGILPGLGGFEVTEFFCVGTTSVTYTLTDLAGNIHECSFEVTVVDAENPVVVCPTDIIVNLNGGECRIPVCFDPVSTMDNCAVVDTVSTPPSCSEFEIGTTLVTIEIFDAAGNSDLCTFNVTVNEFIPATTELACNDLIQISLDATCVSEITPDMIFEGDNYGCYENYQITITDGLATLPTNPFVGLDDVGETYIVNVLDPATGNSCWSEITIEDKLNPEIACPADLTIFCNESKFPANTGLPTLLSCEQSTTQQFNDLFSDNPPCDNIRGVLERTFTITDESDNFADCQQVITIKRLSVADVTFPQSFDGFAQPILSCVDLANNSALTDVANTGLPTVNGLSIMNQPYCGISVTMEEDVYPTCTGSYDILRTFNIYDPCLPVTAGVNPFSYIQVIKVVDNTPPVIECPQDYTVSTNASTECSATETILAATVSDDCSSTEVHTDLPSGTVLTNGGLAFDMEVGTYLVTYYAYDDCGNLATCSFNLSVADLTSPVPVCDEITTVDLSSDGLAEVFVETFDDGSYDDCCLDRLEVRRMEDNCNIATNTIFDGSVTFCCEDVANSPIMVAMQAVDCVGNTNICMIQVIVEDKLAPTIGCPANAEITCDEYADIFGAVLSACENTDETVEDNCQSAEITAAGYGTPFGFDNCTFSMDTTVTVTLNQCGIGSIVRTYSITDASGNGGFGPATCSQVIAISLVSDFVVEFPENLEGFCDQATPEFGEPEIFFETCELVATSFSDQLFTNVPGACFKVVREWTVINWCVVGDNIDQEANAIELSEQELNEDLDGDGDFDERTFRDSYRGFPTSDNDPDADDWDGFITYQQHVKVIDNEAPVINSTFVVTDLCILNGNDGTDNDFSDCVFTGILPTPTYEDCTLAVEAFDDEGNPIINELTITAEVFDMDGNIISNSVNVSDLEVGTYSVRYLANDMCGNSTITEFMFNVTDCKFPTPYCKDGLVITLMAINDPNNTSFENMIEIWATDFDEGSYDNCAGDVQVSLSSDVNDVNAVYNCDNLGENTVELWVTDASGNQDFCETFVIIQAPFGGCDLEDALIVGEITNSEDEGVQDVTVGFNSNNGFTTSYTTNSTGNFTMGVPLGGDYTITPAKDINYHNGVTTFDLVNISKHILNIEYLDTPYKMIAADVNNSQGITTLDLVQLRKLILNIDTEFSNNTSWRFVDKGYVFPDSTNPWAEAFPEVLNLNNLMTNQTALDFIGIKIGDTNGSAQANQLLGADDRSFGKLDINVADQRVTAGEIVTVEFNAADFNHFGYQFTLAFENMTFVDLKEGLATTENFGLHLLEEGILTTSWHEAAAREMKDATLFTATFQTTAAGQLSDFLRICPTHTVGEAYAANGDLQAVNLNFENAGITEKFELYQNFPNPFDDQTSIRFYLPTAEDGTLTITDIDGKVIHEVKDNFKEGLNQINLNRESMGSYGVLYYQLSTQNYSATRRMVFIGQ
jgi:hypothetical protein